MDLNTVQHGGTPPFRISPESLAAWNKSAQEQLLWLREHGAESLSQIPKPADARGVCVIVEPRAHPNLEFVLRNFMFLLAPIGWGLVIIHGTENGEFVRDIIHGWPNVGLMGLSVANLPKSSDYSRLLCQSSFWERLPNENILIFQTDTMLLSNKGLGGGSDTSFLEYAYVGAPWWLTCPLSGNMFRPGATGKTLVADGESLKELYPNLVGNGGLSFRKRSAMMEACSTFQPRAFMTDGDTRVPIECSNEDVFFSVAVNRLEGHSVCPRDIAVRFSVEEVTPLTLDSTGFITCGLHRSYSYQHPDIIRVLIESSEIVKAMVGKEE